MYVERSTMSTATKRDPKKWAAAKAREAKREQERLEQKRKEELKEIAGYATLIIIMLTLGGIILYFLGKWTGKL